jgi:glutamyl-tRNA reductase
MELICLGLNHRTAPIELRERFAVTESHLPEAAGTMISQVGLSEGVILSTCNRTEYYGVAEDGTKARELLRAHVESLVGQRLEDEHLYERELEDVMWHLCRVVSGLDSMIVGETEIFGQVKRAYQIALDSGHTSGNLNKVFQKAFGVGKRVRTVTRIQGGQTSVGSVAVDLAEKIFGSLKGSHVVVVGAGEMSRITAQSLKSRGADSIIVTNRSYERAVELAEEMGGRAVKFDHWEQTLAKVDVVISSTSAPHYVVTPEQIQAVRHTRKYRPLFLIDIAVPRDIDPAVGAIEEVYLYDIDTLQQLANDGRAEREKQVLECEGIIEEELRKGGLIR